MSPLNHHSSRYGGSSEISVRIKIDIVEQPCKVTALHHIGNYGGLGGSFFAADGPVSIFFSLSLSLSLSGSLSLALSPWLLLSLSLSLSLYLSLSLTLSPWLPLSGSFSLSLTLSHSLNISEFLVHISIVLDPKVIYPDVTHQI
eukprot:sb/3473995/